MSGTLASAEVICGPQQTLDGCLKKVANGETIIIIPGNYTTAGIFIGSNTDLWIQRGATILLDEKTKLNPNARGGIAQAVVMVKGTPQNPIVNVNIRLDGVIDGQKDIHTLDKGGFEGINLVYNFGTNIYGSGIVKNANGDGIDIDASNGVIIRDVTVMNNGGSGIHFGAPRPINPSLNNIIINVTSQNNGFLRERNGFDLSWPNPNGATFINSIAIGNFRNWEIETEGVIVGSVSRDGSVNDNVREASFAEINGADQSGFNFVRKRTKVLLVRDIKRLLRLEVPEYLLGLEYSE